MGEDAAAGPPGPDDGLSGAATTPIDEQQRAAPAQAGGGGARRAPRPRPAARGQRAAGPGRDVGADPGAGRRGPASRLIPGVAVGQARLTATAAPRAPPARSRSG